MQKYTVMSVQFKPVFQCLQQFRKYSPFTAYRIFFSRQYYRRHKYAADYSHTDTSKQKLSYGISHNINIFIISEKFPAVHPPEQIYPFQPCLFTVCPIYITYRNFHAVSYILNSHKSSDTEFLHKFSDNLLNIYCTLCT